MSVSCLQDADGAPGAGGSCRGTRVLKGSGKHCDGAAGTHRDRKSEASNSGERLGCRQKERI